MLEKIEQMIEKIKIELKPFIKPFFILFTIYLFGYSTILRSNFFYIDDVGRTYDGYRGWENFSRFSSNFLSKCLHTQKQLTDIAPLTQIIAVIILAVSGIIILYVFTNRKQYKIIEYITVLLIGFCPFFLECISYRFDAPYMALSILCGVVPILFFKKNKYLLATVIIFSTLIMCTTYQASSGIFLMFVILYILEEISNKKNSKDIIKTTSILVGSYLLGLIIFKVFIMVPVSFKGYVSNQTPNVSNFLEIVINNYKRYFGIVLIGFKKLWLILILLINFLFIVTYVYNSKNNKIASFIIILLGIIGINLCSFGLYPLLSQPLFAPRAMYGLGISISLMTVYIAVNSRNYFNKLVIFVLFWIFFVFAFNYGNALYQQKEYQRFRMEVLINSLVTNKLLDGKLKKIQIKGSVGYAPVLRKEKRMPKILYNLVPVTFGNTNWWWNYQEFILYYNLKNLQVNNSLDKEEKEMKLIEKNIYQSIRIKDDKILVELYN